jgi:hypothetical protein
MVYYVSANSPYQYPVYPKFIHAPVNNAFGGVAFEQHLEELDLHAVEREFYAKGRGAMHHGYRVLGDGAPRKMLWPGGTKALPEFIMNNCFAVSPRLRDLIADFEPGLHQFLPVDIYKKKDADPVATFFWLNVCNRIDSVNEVETNLNWTLDYTGKHGFWDDYEVQAPKLVFSTEKTKPFHLWIDPNVSRPYFYCSNAFAKASAAADFPGLTLTFCEEA